MRYVIAAISLVLLAALAGCGGGGTTGADAPSPAPAPTETRTVTERPPEEPPATVTEEPPAPEPRTVTPPPDIAPQGEAENCLYTTAQPEIQEGSSGPAVQKAQCYLNLALSSGPIPEDGDFGPVTDDATRRFQACAGLTVDGLIGPQTWPELIFWANSGAYVC